MNKRTAPPSDNRAILHTSGFRATPGRLSFLRALQKTRKPLSISSIHKQLNDKNVDLATLYRMVNALVKKGIIRQIDFQHGHAHYELATQTHHHHIICEHCGKVVDISKCDISGVEKEALKISGFKKVNKHSLEFFGICKACAKKGY